MCGYVFAVVICLQYDIWIKWYRDGSNALFSTRQLSETRRGDEQQVRMFPNQYQHTL